MSEKMTEDQAIGRGEILALTTEIVSAHLANNAVVQGDDIALHAIVCEFFAKMARWRNYEVGSIGVIHHEGPHFSTSNRGDNSRGIHL